jgi:TetR/AcrR family transcriptional repressor of nem operon
MPWPSEHKRETRERIVEAAAAAFRELGVPAVGVGEVMRRAGLTHGGFYAHFTSKDELLAAAMARASDETIAVLDSLDSGASTDLASAVDAYLCPAHLTHPERGCPIAALGPELSRGPQNVRQALAKQLRKRLDHLAALVNPRIREEVRQRRADATLACMVGGMIVARGLKPAEREPFLENCRTFMRDALQSAPNSR